MASHWYNLQDDLEPVGDIEERHHSTRLLERTLEELLRKPDLNSVIASTKAWCRAAWFTTDGKTFYIRNHETSSPESHLPPSSREEVIIHAQEQYRRLLRYMRLYDRFLHPKLNQIMDSQLSLPEKVDRVYWMRLCFPAHVACRLPVVSGWNIERFCWGWDYDRHQHGSEPSKNQERSNRLIDRLFVDRSILWSY